MTLSDVKINNKYTYVRNSPPTVTGVEGESYLDLSTGLSFIKTDTEWSSFEENLDAVLAYRREGFYRSVLSAYGCVNFIFEGLYSIVGNVITAEGHTAENNQYYFGEHPLLISNVTVNTFDIDGWSEQTEESYGTLCVYNETEALCQVAGQMFWFDEKERGNEGIRSEKIGNYSVTKDFQGKAYPAEILNKLEAISCKGVCGV